MAEKIWKVLTRMRAYGSGCHLVNWYQIALFSRFSHVVLEGLPRSL